MDEGRAQDGVIEGGIVAVMKIGRGCADKDGGIVEVWIVVDGDGVWSSEMMIGMDVIGVVRSDAVWWLSNNDK